MQNPAHTAGMDTRKDCPVHTLERLKSDAPVPTADNYCFVRPFLWVIAVASRADTNNGGYVSVSHLSLCNNHNPETVSRSVAPISLSLLLRHFGFCILL